MKILLNNQELIFDNVSLKDNNIYIKSDFEIGTIMTNYKINYDEFINILKTSLECYVDCSKENTFETIEQYFNYFKITSNPLVKKNMITKITYILINDISLKEDKKIMDLLKNYSSYKTDKYYAFLRIVLNINHVNMITNKKTEYFDDEYFTMLDFILDYY